MIRNHLQVWCLMPGEDIRPNTAENNEKSGRPPTTNVSSGGNQLADIEDTRFAINDVEESIKKNNRILAQLIKSNDPRGVGLVPFFKDRIEIMQQVDTILEDHLKKIGGR